MLTQKIRCNFTENILGTGELKIEWCGAFSPQGAWHLEIEVLLTSFNNVYIRGCRCTGAKNHLYYLPLVIDIDNLSRQVIDVDNLSRQLIDLDNLSVLWRIQIIIRQYRRKRVTKVHAGIFFTSSPNYAYECSPAEKMLTTHMITLRFQSTYVPGTQQVSSI